MYVRIKKTQDREYIQLVASQREGKKVRQVLVASLGRLDEWIQSGTIENAIATLIRYTERYLAISDTEDAEVLSSKRSGAVLLFEKLWKKLGVGDAIRKALQGRKYEFDVERAIFLSVVHRIMASGSDRSAEDWREDYAFDEAILSLSLHHLYRAMAFLGSPISGPAEDTPISHRCVKDDIEESLFERNRASRETIDMAFFDTAKMAVKWGAGLRPIRSTTAKMAVKGGAGLCPIRSTTAKMAVKGGAGLRPQQYLSRHRCTSKERAERSWVSTATARTSVPT
jgi:hypothetical protein